MPILIFILLSFPLKNLSSNGMYICIPTILFYFIFVFFNLKIQLLRRPVDSLSKDSRLDGG